MFVPVFGISPAAAKALMEIEASRQAVIELPINVEVLASLRETARLAATHYSTQIEGNRLTRASATTTGRWSTWRAWPGRPDSSPSTNCSGPMGW